MSEVTQAPTSTGASESTGSDTSNEGSDNQSENQEQTEGAQQAAAAKPVVPASTKKKFKYKVDGEEVEEEIDLADEEGLTKRLRQSRASDKRFSEAQAMKAKALDIIKTFENDPENVFEKLGPKGREAAEKFLLKKIQEEMLTPEERAQRQEKAELEKYRNQEKLTKEQQQQKALEEKSFKFAQEYQNTIIQALEKLSLPKSPALVKSMAALMDKNLRLGLELDAAELAELVREDKNGEVRAITKDMDGDQLIAFFGDEIANKIRKSDLKKLQEKHNQPFGSKQDTQSSPSTKQNRPMSMDEWKQQMAERFK